MSAAASPLLASLQRLEPRALLGALAALAAALALALLAWRRLRRAGGGPPLTREFQRFPVVAREVANGGPRPVIFLTVRVSTAALPTGAHVKLRAVVGGREVLRSYTPTRFHRGECELCFRVYEGGPMTQHLAALRVGDAVEMMGPTGVERYGEAGPGTFARGSAQEWAGITHVGLVSGGTGITPMLQITNHVLQDPRDRTRLAMLSFTTTPEDIVLEAPLRALAAGSGGQLRLTFAASHDVGAEALRARPAGMLVRASMRELDADALAALLGVPAGPHTMVCVCGPDGFAKRAKELLAQRFENVLVW